MASTKGDGVCGMCEFNREGWCSQHEHHVAVLEGCTEYKLHPTFTIKPDRPELPPLPSDSSPEE